MKRSSVATIGWESELKTIQYLYLLRVLRGSKRSCSGTIELFGKLLRLLSAFVRECTGEGRRHFMHHRVGTSILNKSAFYVVKRRWFGFRGSIYFNIKLTSSAHMRERS